MGAVCKSLVPVMYENQIKILLQGQKVPFADLTVRQLFMFFCKMFYSVIRGFLFRLKV